MPAPLSLQFLSTYLPRPIFTHYIPITTKAFNTLTLFGVDSAMASHPSPPWHAKEADADTLHSNLDLEAQVLPLSLDRHVNDAIAARHLAIPSAYLPPNTSMPPAQDSHWHDHPLSTPSPLPALDCPPRPRPSRSAYTVIPRPSAVTPPTSPFSSPKTEGKQSAYTSQENCLYSSLWCLPFLIIGLPLTFISLKKGLNRRSSSGPMFVGGILFDVLAGLMLLIAVRNAWKMRRMRGLGRGMSMDS